LKLTVDKVELIEMLVTLKGRLDRLENKLDAVMSGLIDEEINNIVNSKQLNQEELRPWTFSKDFPESTFVENDNCCVPTPENLCLYQAIEVIDMPDGDEALSFKGVVS
jgi:hypothetical protein